MGWALGYVGLLVLQPICLIFFRLDLFGFRQLNARQCRRVAEFLTAQRAGRKCMCE